MDTRLRPAVLTLAFSAACGLSPCERYVEAAIACHDRAGTEVPAKLEADAVCDDTEQPDALYACWTDAYNLGDCATEQGLAEILDEVNACREDLADPDEEPA